MTGMRSQRCKLMATGKSGCLMVPNESQTNTYVVILMRTCISECHSEWQVMMPRSKREETDSRRCPSQNF